jgi:hypothetical protein
VEVSFIGGGNGSTRRKPPTCHRKSLTNFITLCCIEYTSPLANLGQSKESQYINRNVMKIQYNVPVMAYHSRETITEVILPINLLIKILYIFMSIVIREINLTHHHVYLVFLSAQITFTSCWKGKDKTVVCTNENTETGLIWI